MARRDASDWAPVGLSLRRPPTQLIANVQVAAGVISFRNGTHSGYVRSEVCPHEGGGAQAQCVVVRD